MSKRNKRWISCLSAVIIMLFTVFLSTPSFAVGEETEEVAQVLVTGYKASVQEVTPGKDFTLTVTVKNFSKNVAAENVIVKLSNPTGVVPQYGTVSTMRIESVKANATAEVVFKLTSDEGLAVSNLNFTVGVECGKDTNNTQISIPVAEKPEVGVTGYTVTKTPVIPGEDFTVTLEVKNFSKRATAQDVVVSLSNPAGVIPKYGTVNIERIDSIAPNVTVKVNFTFTATSDLAVSELYFTTTITGNFLASSTQFSIPVKEKPEVGVTGYEITKTPIVPGEEFTVTLDVKNFSKKATAKDVVVSLSNPSGVIPEYGTVNVVRIASIAPNGTVKVNFTFTATSDLSANELYFTATVSGNNLLSSNTQFSVPIKKIAQLYVEGYELTGETIAPGNDFTLKVHIKNQSEDVTVKNILVMITNPNGVVPEYGEVGTAVIDVLEPGKIGEVSFHYSSDSNIKTSELNFGVNVFYDNMSTSAQVRVPVGRMADFSVEESSMPEKLLVGKAGYASAVIENLGETGVSNVAMVARCDGKDIAVANIGSLSANTLKTQSLSLMFEEEGQYAVDLLLTYTNGEGQNKEVLISSSIVPVVAEEEIIINGDDEGTTPTDTPELKPEPEPEKGMNNILLLSVSGVLLIGLCCVILILLYRRKK